MSQNSSTQSIRVLTASLTFICINSGRFICSVFKPSANWMHRRQDVTNDHFTDAKILKCTHTTNDSANKSRAISALTAKPPGNNSPQGHFWLVAQNKKEGIFKMYCIRDFSGGPVLRLHVSTAENECLIPGWGTKILQAMQQGQKKKKKMYCINSGGWKLKGFSYFYI